jgi:hypothetical protein
MRTLYARLRNVEFVLKTMGGHRRVISSGLRVIQTDTTNCMTRRQRRTQLHNARPHYKSKNTNKTPLFI